GRAGCGPQHREPGWLIMVDPTNDIIQFDVCGHQSANYAHGGNLRRVRNETDPKKWLPGDPFGPAIPPFDEKDIQTVSGAEGGRTGRPGRTRSIRRRRGQAVSRPRL